jgi:hypothetical protein
MRRSPGHRWTGGTRRSPSGCKIAVVVAGTVTDPAAPGAPVDSPIFSRGPLGTSLAYTYRSKSVRARTQRTSRHRAYRSRFTLGPARAYERKRGGGAYPRSSDGEGIA